MARSIEKATAGTVVAEGGNSRFNALPAGEYSVSVYDVTEDKYKNGGNKGRPNYRAQLRVADGQVGANRRLFETIGLFRTWAPTDKNPEGSDNFTAFGFFAAVDGVTEKDYRKGVQASLLDPTEDADAIEEALAAIKDEKYRAKVAKFAGKGWQVPEPKELLGKKINVALKVEADTYAFNKALKEWTDSGESEEDFPETQEDFTTNRVASFKPFKEVSQGKAVEPEERFEL